MHKDIIYNTHVNLYSYEVPVMIRRSDVRINVSLIEDIQIIISFNVSKVAVAIIL